MSARRVVLGVDSSTQSCTVEIRLLDSGELIATGRAAHPVTTPPVSEQDPNAWWQAFVHATRDALNAAGDVDVVAISVGAQCHGLVMTDSTGAPLRSAKLWNDTTSAEQASQMAAWRDTPWWADTTCIAPSAALTLSKIMWIRDHEPELLDRVSHVMVPHDWLTMRLTGRAVTDRSDASGTGYFETPAGAWRPDIVEELVGHTTWADKLPHLLGPNEPAGTIRPEVAAELGVSSRALVGPGGGDQHLAAQGIGLVAGEAAFSIGTSGVVFATTPDPVVDPTGVIDGVANTTGGYLPLVSTLNAAKVTDAIARVLNVSHAQMSALALSAQTSSSRPVFATYLDGERKPQMPWAKGMLSGLGSDVTPGDIALVAYEGVVMGLERGARRMRDFGVQIDKRIIAIGGGGRAEAFRQIIADFSGLPVHTVDATEATARGAAVQAAAIARETTVEALTVEWAPAPLTENTPQERAQEEVFQRYLELSKVQAHSNPY